MALVRPGGRLTAVEVRIHLHDSRRDDNLVGVLAIERRSTEVQVPQDQQPGADFLSRYVAGKLSDATWPVVTEQWSASVDPLHAEVVAVSAEDLQAAVHDLALGAPARAGADLVGLPPAAGAVLGDVASALPLPLDKLLGPFADAARMTGIVVGLAAGQPALALASVKSLAAKEFTKLVESVVDAAVDRVAQPDAAVDRVAQPDAAADSPGREPQITDSVAERLDRWKARLREIEPEPATLRWRSPAEAPNDCWWSPGSGISGPG